jgi:hypothetical protein
MATAQVKTSSTVAALLVQIAQALHEPENAGRDPYRIVAPLVIEGYDDLDKSELGYVPGGEFGLCHGRVDGTPALSVQATVDMFVQLVTKGLSWVYPTTRSSWTLREIDLAAIDLAYRLHRMGLSLTRVGYTKDTWCVSCGGRSSAVLCGFESVDDPRVLYVVEQLERLRMDEIGKTLDAHAFDVIVSHMLASFDAGHTNLGKHGFAATCR